MFIIIYGSSAYAFKLPSRDNSISTRDVSWFSSHYPRSQWMELPPYFMQQMHESLNAMQLFISGKCQSPCRERGTSILLVPWAVPFHLTFSAGSHSPRVQYWERRIPDTGGEVGALPRGDNREFTLIEDPLEARHCARTSSILYLLQSALRGRWLVS